MPPLANWHPPQKGQIRQYTSDETNISRTSKRTYGRCPSRAADAPTSAGCDGPSSNGQQLLGSSVHRSRPTKKSRRCGPPTVSGFFFEQEPGRISHPLLSGGIHCVGVPNASPHDMTQAVSPEAHCTANTTAGTVSPGCGTQQTHTQRTPRPARTTTHTPQPHARL